MNTSIIANELGVSERTVSRYLMDIQQAGYPLYFDRSSISYRFANGFRLVTHSDNKNDRELQLAMDLKSRMLFASAAGLASYDETGQCVYCNDAICQISGGTQDQLLAQNYTRLQSWSVSGLLLMARQVMNNGITTSGDFYLNTSFGRQIWLYCTMSRFERDNRPYLMQVALDITSRKLVEEQLRMFKSVAEASREAIAISDTVGRLIYVNPAHERLFGRPLAEATACNYRDYYPPESIDILNREVAPALSRGEGWEGVLTAVDKNGRTFLLWERADTILDEQGQILYHFGLMHEVIKREVC